MRFCTHFSPLSYRCFYDLLINIDISQRLPIDIDIDIFQNCLIDIDIDIFQNCLIDIDINIDIFQTLLVDIDIDIDIFKNLLVDIDIFQICRYIDYRYKYSIFHQQIRGKKGQNRLKTGKNDRILHNYFK